MSKDVKYWLSQNIKYIIITIIINGEEITIHNNTETIEINILLIFQCKKFLNKISISTNIDLINLNISFIKLN